ncbi:MAG: substrate-binding domain-containing protein [Micromonosporaceae bacterium]|nr:substrate-binding domain-containing protein [Micromonosporaceae bacterium]
MRKGVITFAAVGLVASLGLVACSQPQEPEGTDDKPKVGVILPDQASAVRWETADRRYLKEAFDAAGIEAEIVNAQGSTENFLTLADQLITSGVDILMIVNLDSGSGAAALQKARNAGVKTIDYDRLTLNGGADYYVSFDNVEVGRLQGRGLIKCLEDMGVQNPRIVYLNGSPTDNNATLFREGYDTVLQDKYKEGWVFVDERSVPDWDGTQAVTLFEQMYTAHGGGIDGVLAANDTLGNSAITVLRNNGLNGKVPVTGQDASTAGLQNILAGDQCMTVYKAIKKEAYAAAELAIALAKGETPANLTTVHDPEANRDVPSRLEKPVAIFKDNVKDVVDDGFVTVAELCTADFAALCEEAGIS